MAGPGLPENVDTTYGDDPGDDSVKIHQGHHDTIHDLLNNFDTGIGTANSGDVLTWDGSVYAPAASTAFTWQGAWATSTVYAADDAVENDGSSYLCISGHTSSASDEPGVGGSWETYWDLMAQQGAVGDQGEMGDQGPPGERGVQGVAGPAAEAVQVITASGTSQTLDATDASIYDITLTDTCTITLDGPSPACALTLLLRQDGTGSRTVTWANAVWPAATAPTLTTTPNKIDVVTFVKVQTDSGPLWMGATMGQNYTQGAASYDTLAVEVVADAPTSTSDQSTDYTSAASYQLDDEAVGVAFVVLSRAGTTDPEIPTFSGGGATWTQGVTQTFGTSDPRRRLTVFFAREATVGAAAPFVVGINGVLHSGCVVKVVQTGRAGADALTTALAKDVSNNGVDASPTVTLGSEEASTSRPLVAFAMNTNQTVTLDTDFTAVGSYLSIINPTLKLVVAWRDDAWESPASMTNGVSTVWAAIATELEQT